MSKTFPYRPDIDGLRAVAVLSVLGFHAFPKWMSGGFIGVDIFFVISGFLITRILLDQMSENTFSFKDFYIRRIHRLFPALIVLLIGCLLLGGVVLFPDEHGSLGNSTAYSSAFLANWKLYKDVGYFDAASSLKPLLNLWSLGIEEQFYFVFPVVIFILQKTRYLLFFLLASFLFSFGFNIISLSHRSTEFCFYLLPTRFWEFIVGAGVAYIYVFHEAKLKKIPPLSRLLFSFGGTICILASIVFLDDKMKFPGWWTLLPTGGAVLLILAGPLAWINKNILSQKLPIFIGLISYPLYLWHWPLLSFATIVEGKEPSLWIKTIAIFLSVVFAILTYRLIEKPLRKKRGWTTAFLIVAMVLIGGTGKIIAKQIISFSPENKEILPITSAMDDWQYPPHGFKSLDKDGVALLKPGKTSDTVLFMGDSNMQQYASRIGHLIDENKTSKSAIFITGGGCPPIPNIYSEMHPKCETVLESAINFSNQKNIKTVAICAHWNGYTGAPYYYKKNNDKLSLGKQTLGEKAAYLGLKYMIQSMIRNNKKVYLILNMPSGGEFCPKNMIKRSYFGNHKKRVLEIQKDLISQRVKDTHSILKRIGKETGATVIDPVEFLCPSKTCLNIDKKGQPLYKDVCHLRASYVKEQATFLDQIMD